MMETRRSPEPITRTALLGVRFWDEVTCTPVQNGLMVELRDPANRFKRLLATPNKSGVHVLHDAPGLIRSARGAGDDNFWRNLPEHSELVVEVRDTSGRFQPLAITARLPARGFFTPNCLTTSSPTAESFIPLFSAPTRSAPGGMAVVRAELHAWNDRAPVSWALLTAEYRGEVLGRGLSDSEGKVAVIFPYPEPESLWRTSPPGVATLPRWDLDLRVYHAAEMVGVKRPELCSLLAQPRARLLDGLSPAADLGHVTLLFGRELVVRSANSSFLFVAPV